MKFQAELIDLTSIRPNLIGDWLAKCETVCYRFVDLGYEMYTVYWHYCESGANGCHSVSAASANEMLRELRCDPSGFSIKCTTYSEGI